MSTASRHAGAIVRIANFLCIVSAIAILLALVAIMALFMGSESRDLAALISALRIWSIMAVVITIFALALCANRTKRFSASGGRD